MKKLIILISILFTYRANYAQWHAVPMPELPVSPNGQPFVGHYGFIYNHPDTIVGRANASQGSGISLTAFYYSINRGLSYSVLFTRVADDRFPSMPPIQLKSGSILSGRIYIPNNDFTAWDTTSTVNLFKNLRVDPWWYKRHGNYLEDSVGYYVTNDGTTTKLDTLFKSTDLGLTKTIVLDSITSKYMLGKIFVLDKNHVWARRNYPLFTPSALGSLQILYRTRDGGATWQKVTTNLDTINQPSFDVRDIYFVSPDTGYMGVNRGVTTIKMGELYRTTDGGSTWQKITEIPFQEGLGYAFERLFFINSKIGFSYGNVIGAVRKTTDGGYSWVQQQSLPVTGYREMTLTGNNLIWVRNSGGGLYYTTNFGDPIVGVEEVTLNRQLSVNLFPNPTKSGSFTLQWDAENNEPAHIEVFDVMGKRVYQISHTDIQAGENQLKLHIETQPGLYYVRIQQGGRYATKNVVISR